MSSLQLHLSSLHASPDSLHLFSLIPFLSLPQPLLQILSSSQLSRLLRLSSSFFLSHPHHPRTSSPPPCRTPPPEPWGERRTSAAPLEALPSPLPQTSYSPPPWPRSQ